MVVPLSGQTFYLALFDSRRQLVASGQFLTVAVDRIVAAIIFPAAPAADYYLRISSDAAGCYQLGGRAGSELPDPFEPNDDFASATPITLPFGGVPYVNPATDVDFFVFSVPEGAHFVASATVLASCTAGTAFALALFDSHLVVVASGGTDYSTGSAFLDVVGLPAGDYFLRISADAVGCYSLQVSADVPPPDPFEPNNDLALAAPITLNVMGGSTAALTFGDLDFYRFDAPVGSELLATASSTWFEPLVALFDAAGRRLAAGSFVRLRLEAEGTYFIGVTTADDPGFRGAGREGAYSISVFVFGPRVLVPGHPLEFALREPFGSLVAADGDTGVIYVLGSRLFRFTGGRVQPVSEVLAPELLDVAVRVGPETLQVRLPPFTDLAFAGGFGGADLLAIETRGPTIALDAITGARRLFADTRGGPLFTSLALAPDRLFVSSGFAGSGPAIFAVDGAGSVATFMAPPALSGIPGALAVSPDGRSLYYGSIFGGDLVQVDLRSGSEVGRVPVGPPLGAPNIAVDPATGDVYAIVNDLARFLGGGATRVPLPGSLLVRYNRATGDVQPFAEDIPFLSDLAFGPCAEERGSQEWCLWVTMGATGLGLMKIGGFDPPFVRDPVGDAPSAIDVRQMGARYVDLAGSGSSTHLEVTLHLEGEPREGEFHVFLDYGESADLGPDVDLRLDLAGGQGSWSGLTGLGETSYIAGREIHFLVPIEALRRLASDEQKFAAAERVLLWAQTRAEGGADRAPDAQAFLFRSFYPRLAILPGTLDFGQVQVGQQKIAEVAVTNAGIGPAPITNVQVTGYDFSLAGPVPESIPEGATASIPVACDAFRAAFLQGKLHVRSQAPIGDRQVALNCEGFY